MPRRSHEVTSGTRVEYPLSNKGPSSRTATERRNSSVSYGHFGCTAHTIRMRPSLVLALLLLPGSAFGEESKATTEPMESPAGTHERVVVDNGPNRLLLTTGFVTIGFAYAMSAYVALGSHHASEKWLYVPVAGPWVAFARPDGLDATSRALLVADGLVQLAGVAQLAAAFVTRELKERDRPIIVPLRVEGGAGAAAVGTF